MAKFNPSAYQTYTELPLEQQSNFKPVEGGFVRKSAAEDVKPAHEEALVINNNLHKLDKLTYKITEDYMGKLALLTNESYVLIPLNKETEENLAERAEIYKEALHKIPGKTEQATQLMVGNHVTEEIDQSFVEEIFLILDLYDAKELKNSLITSAFMQRAVKALKIRNLERKEEATTEKKTVVSLSQNREMSIITSAHGNSARLELPFHTDPEKFPVESGANAVVEILGAKLTDADYEAIATGLVVKRGKVRDAALKYAEATELWAETLAKTSMESGSELQARRQAAIELMQVVGFSMHADIPIYAIFTTIIRRYPELNHIETPQPYVS